MGEKQKIVIVDDEADTRKLLRLSLIEIHDKYEIIEFDSPINALEKINKINNISLLITDIMMPSINGYQFAQIFRDKHKDIPILFISVSSFTPDTLLTITEIGKADCISKPFDPYEIIVHIKDALNGFDMSSNTVSFVVHGQDKVRLDELTKLINGELGLNYPIKLNEKPSRGLTIIEKLENISNEKIDVVFIMLTPDDMICDETNTENNNKIRRARQNVILELGYFIGRFGRKSGKIIILYDKNVELPSDINGIVYIDITNGIEESKGKIINEMQHITNHKKSLRK
ncbi:nucleotide-binding protein [bacterium]|nr:nucleotide-binding protein [bacterium]